MIHPRNIIPLTENPEVDILILLLGPLCPPGNPLSALSQSMLNTLNKSDGPSGKNGG